MNKYRGRRIGRDGLRWRLALAFILGAIATFALMGLSVIANECGYELASRIVFWQNTLLQSLVLPINIGYSEHAVYEGSPLNFLAFLASMPLGIVVYGIAAFTAMSQRSKRHRSS
jgi:hypothetical protein